MSWFRQIKLQTALVLLLLHYINTLNQELSGTKADEQTSAEEKSANNHHVFQNATRFGVSVDEDQERLPTTLSGLSWVRPIVV